MLTNKNAVIYAAGGSVAGAVAKAFAAAGATVFLTGRNPGPIQKLADEIVAKGGKARVAQVDAMDEKAVSEHLKTVVEQAGTVDISFNLIDMQVVQGMPLVDVSLADFVRPVTIAMQSHFITATAAARVMMKQKSGVILTLTATPGGIGYPCNAGFAPACCAIECLSRNLATELGVYGVRAVNIRSGGSPDSRVFAEALAANPDSMRPFLETIANDTMLKRLPLMADIANTAVFLASGMAAGITGVTVDVTCGTTAALNYKTQGGTENAQFNF
jgi:3-oxoacyl-[acyl-carrier protein] reductase